MRYRVVHRVRFRFLHQVAGAQLSVMLRPRDLAHQCVRHHQLLAEPRAQFEPAVHDAHGNHRQPLLLATAVRELELSAVSLIDLHDRVDRARAADARHAETRVRAILAESGAVSAHGSCQDRATFALARLRAARHTARYVAGYRIATPTALARTQAHAWIAIELDDGWIDFDPTTGGLCREHITVSFGHGYDEVAPLGGVLFAERGVGYRQTSAVTIEPIPVAAELASAVEGVEPPSSARPAVPLTKTAASIGDRP